MNISAFFIARPIGTLLLTIGLGLAGLGAFFVLPVAPLPQVDIPTISVQAQVPGASPDTMASSVASPLERRLATIAGVTELTSRSSVGATRITLQFDLRRNIDGAARDVQAAINAARADLPSTLKRNPTYTKANPADAPIMILTLTSTTRSSTQIYDAVANLVQERLLQVEGVGDVELGGAALPSVRVDVNPLSLARFGIALEDVRAVLAASSANRPRGVLETHDVAWQIYGDPPGLHAQDFSGLVVAWRNGAAVRLADVAKVYDGPEDVRTAGEFNGRNAVSVVISRQPGANIIATVDGVKAQLPLLRASLPADIDIQTASDRTKTIRASLRDVETSLAIATLLVVLVVSLFLRSWRATLVPAVAVVVSLLATLGGMYLFGFSLNNLSLMALTIATGFVVDDAIVVLENIAHHVEAGMAPRVAALRGAREVGFTVVSISVSLVAAFIPLLFMGGIPGRLFREFSVTLAMAVMISLVVALTTTPMLASRLFRGPSRGGAFTAFIERTLARVEAGYAHNLDWALANRGAMLTMLAGAVVLNVFLISVSSKGLFPDQDTGLLQGGVRADQSMSFVALQQKLHDIGVIVAKDPAVANVVSFTGGARAGSGFMFATLKPKRDRPSSRAIIARLRPKLAQVRGVSIALNPVQDVRSGGRSSNSAYQYTLEGDDVATLRRASLKLVSVLKQDPMFTDVDVDLQEAGADVFVDVDRASAARLGVSAQAVDNALYDAFGQRQVANIYDGLNQYHVVMAVDRAFNGSPVALDHVYVPVGNAAAAAAGSAAPRTTVPLSAFARWRSGATAAQVNHQDGQAAVTISFNTANGVSLGAATERVIELQTSAGLPASVHGAFAGTAKLFAQTTASTPLLIGAALAVIYIVLGVLYESAIHPLTVLSTLPSAGVGAVLALIATGTPLDLIGLIGIVLLIGIVKKNGIMIIDFALEAERSRGLTPLQAIREACIRRFRPILMTTLAAAFSAVPLAIGFGDGAELRRPLGIAIFGGMIASQFLTLLTTPVVYLALDRFRRRGRNERLFARHGMDGAIGANAP